MFFFDICANQNKNNLEYEIYFDYNKLEEFLNDLYEISCIESYKFFSLGKQYDCTDDILLLRKNKNYIVNSLKKNLFLISKEKNKTLSYNDLYELFVINSNKNVKKFYFFLVNFKILFLVSLCLFLEGICM
jgi:hypothetical protein